MVAKCCVSGRLAATVLAQGQSLEAEKLYRQVREKRWEFPVRSFDGCVTIHDPKMQVLYEFCISLFQAVQGLNGMLGNGHADTLVCQRGLASVT